MKQAENRPARQVTLHLTLPILVTLTLLTAAFSTGSPVFLMPALLIALLCLSGIYGVFRASATLEVSSRASTERVQRGEDVTLSVQVKRRGWIPLAPMWLELSGVNGANSTASGTQMMQLRPGRSQALELTFHAAHVGAIHPGVQSVMLSDFFGVCTIRQKPNMDGGELLVLPQLFDIAPLRLSSGEMGTGSDGARLRGRDEPHRRAHLSARRPDEKKSTGSYPPASRRRSSAALKTPFSRTRSSCWTAPNRRNRPIRRKTLTCATR